MPGKEFTKSSSKTSRPKSMAITKTKSKIKKTRSVKEESDVKDFTVENKNRSFLKINKTQKIVILAAVVVVGFLYLFKGLFIVATVNGQPISRISLVKELEKQSGKQTLNSLITKTLILQEAKSKNIVVTTDEVSAEVKKIEETLNKRQQKLDQALLAQGITKDEFLEQVKIQKMVEKMIGKDANVTDKEVEQYINTNKESIPEGTKPEELKANIKTQLEQQKISDKFQKILADLQKKAKINYYVNY